jgi:nucleoside-diphosphate-sugar epimerase
MGYILVTGGSGFIGKKLIEYIKESGIIDPRHVLMLGSSGYPGINYVDHKNYSFTKNDLSNAGVSDISAVIHLGAFIPKSSAELNEYSRNLSNVTNTAWLLNNLTSIPERFIFISTIDVYEKTTELINENITANPETFYGKCKLFCEQLIQQWCDQRSVMLQILRLGHIYGAGEEAYKKLIPETIRKVIKNEQPVIFSDGSERRSFLHVKDCVRCIVQALQLQAFPGPINIASSKSITIKDLVGMIISISNAKLNPLILNQDVPVRHIEFDTSRMESHFGPEFIKLNDGLRDEIDTFMR